MKTILAVFRRLLKSAKRNLPVLPVVPSLLLAPLATLCAEESAPPQLPDFRYQGVVLEAANLKYRPHDDLIFPSVVRVEGRIAKPLGKFHLYYAPHDAPGGTCLAYADRPEGPWREYVAETDAALENVRPLGKIFERTSVSPTNPGVKSPCFIEDGGRLCMFFNTGARLRNKIALAIAEPAAPKAKPRAADSPKPNIVLIMADDQGWGDTGYNGHPELKTPHLDALAASGLRLDRFYAAHSNCSPTRGSVMTGRHPNRYGTFRPGVPIRAQELTVAKVLQSAGYATGHFGKWHLNGKNGAKNTTDMPGRAILAADPLSPGRMGFDEWVSADNYFDLDPVLGRNGVPEKFHGDSSDVTTDEALKFIRKQATAGKPFLTVVWFGSPHDPHLALPADKAAYSALPAKEQNYFGEITAVDRNVGRLRAALRELKVADNTLLWYCSDNGGHQGPKSTGNLRGEKGSLWEGGLRVPGLVEWPARISKPFRSEIPCSTLDIYPTLLEATGAVAQNQIQPLDGVSLIPLFDQKSEAGTKPMPFWDHGTGHAAWLDWPYKLHTNPVTTRYKKSKEDGDLPVTLLYDVSNDPRETTDLAAREPERVAKMTAALQAWKASVEKSFARADYSGQKK